MTRAMARTIAPSVSLEPQLELLDLELLRLLSMRQELTRQMAVRRHEAGQPQFDHQAEFAVIQRFRELGPAGLELAALLLRMSRAR